MLKKPFLVGIAGATASGKTSFCCKIQEALNCSILTMDNFYKPLTQSQSLKDYNFDHPDALDHQEFHKATLKLLSNQQTEIPTYDFKTNNRLPKTQTVQPSSVVLIEGLFGLFEKRQRDLMDLKIFLEVDSDLRLHRRIQRDTTQRGRSLEEVLSQYFKFVKPSYEEFVKGTKKHADLIVPKGAENQAALECIVMYLKNKK